MTIIVKLHNFFQLDDSKLWATLVNIAKKDTIIFKIELENFQHLSSFFDKNVKNDSFFSAILKKQAPHFIIDRMATSLVLFEEPEPRDVRLLPHFMAIHEKTKDFVNFAASFANKDDVIKVCLDGINKPIPFTQEQERKALEEDRDIEREYEKFFLRRYTAVMDRIHISMESFTFSDLVLDPHKKTKYLKMDLLQKVENLAINNEIRFEIGCCNYKLKREFAISIACENDVKLSSDLEIAQSFTAICISQFFLGLLYHLDDDYVPVDRKSVV